MNPLNIIQQFDAFLASRNHKFQAIIIGGTALNLLGVIERQTKDCDVLEPAIPPSVTQLAAEFAALLRNKGEQLGDDWFNNGPRSLIDVLPSGWMARTQTIFSGHALKLEALGREDLLKSKVFALCDRAIDLVDCVALAPTAEELQTLLPWLEQQDGNPDWPQHVRAILKDLARRLGNGF